MYQNQSNFTSYPYGGPANEAPPGWNPNLVPDGQYPPNWYMPEQGPSSSFNGFQQPLPPGYPPGNLAFQPPRQNTTFASPYTPSQSSGLTFENQPFPSGSSSKGDNSSTGPKKKRKKVPVEAEGTASVGSPPGDGEKEKRLKTGRACDACRTKKIRCDILPTDSPDDNDTQPICAHCKQYELECTFFLPITETRFKKRKATEDLPTDQPLALSSSLLSRDVTATSSPVNPEGLTSRQPLGETPSRVEGPTSLSFLLQTALPAGASELYDLREHNKWEVSEDGDGLIKVKAPPSGAHAEGDLDNPAHNRLNRSILSGQTITHLVNAYFDHLAPLFPIISRAEFAAKANPSPLLLYSICGLGATRRHFPREIFAAVRGVINGLLRSNDILSDARFENVQALVSKLSKNAADDQLLLSQVGDLHAQPTAATASAALVRMGIATRMAQDLGLHRESTLQAQTAHDLAYVELRRRVWATCVILDRWYGAALGIPLLIDLLDCDVLLPAPYEIVSDTEPSSWPVDPSFMALSEHLKLSILMGRILKTIYSPTGLKYATDSQLQSLLADMRTWLEELPEELKFRGPDSSFAAGLLHMSYAALQFLFWRVFMRITYTCPPHLTVRLKTHIWNEVVDRSREAIEWLAQNDEALDTLFIYAYTATSCALVQYHTWARRRDPSALDALRLVKEVALKWETTVQPDQMSIRRKTCETMTLLYEAALKTNPESAVDKMDRPLDINPTAGVSTRDAFGRAVYVKEVRRPNGGVWVALTEDDREASGIPREECILASEYDGQIPVDRGNKEDAHDQLGQTHAAPLPQAFQDMQNATNVNPQMNFGEFASEVQQPGIDFSNPGEMGFTDGGVDISMLDGLPVNGFDFPSWEQYFQAINNSTVPSYGF